MASDIRRMNHAELDELNRRSREWREARMRTMQVGLPAPAMAKETTPAVETAPFHVGEQIDLL